MLYTSWRKEITDLISDCQTYQERFKQVKDDILSNRQQYEYHSEILDKAVEDMHNSEWENFDTVAPNTCTKHINKQDCAVKKYSLVNVLVALTLVKASSIASMICLMILGSSLEIVMRRILL